MNAVSDFIFSNQPIYKGVLSKAFNHIYSKLRPPIKEYHGNWGSLAVSQNVYKGFQPYENDKHITVVIGGPLLMFMENDYLTGQRLSYEGTKRIYERWLQGKMKWDEDLSGPFAVLIIDKETNDFFCVTDPMSFIPLFQLQAGEHIMLSTHVDALARAGKQNQQVDEISVVDFILHGIVTYPYTFYRPIKQMQPASIHYYKQNQIQSDYYWLPKEEFKYQSINEAALDLREAITGYIDRILKHTENIAQFISGGEDSRTLAALLSSVPDRKAFVFLEGMNREGQTAQKAAEAYGADFQLVERDKLHYLTILPQCSDLVGSGAEYFHAHSYGFHEICKLDQYDAVFGGLFSDALLKGARIRKLRGSDRFPFIPQVKMKTYSPTEKINNPMFNKEVLVKVQKRRKNHYEFLKTLRNESAEEWFEMWPSSQNFNIPNLHANRRLFPSYEPFMSTQVVKISVAIPQSWKLNRRLFHRFAKPFLQKTKWLFHSEGRLPYFPWYINSIVQFGFWSYLQIGKLFGWIKGSQNPWVDWDELMNSNKWKNTIIQYAHGMNTLMNVTEERDVVKFYNANSFNYLQRVNILQVLYQLSCLKKN